ncbi:MAG: hypothetical protein IT384_06690 [Deltaproteobacteria bacterium]|nr:hypothetical protein [Deltaproteobacteria bacterium]
MAKRKKDPRRKSGPHPSSERDAHAGSQPGSAASGAPASGREPAPAPEAEAAPEPSPIDWQAPSLTLVAILGLNILLKILFTPDREAMGPNSLITTPAIMETFERLLRENPFALFGPVLYEEDRVYWLTTVIFPTHWLYEVLTPLGVYLVTTSLLVFTGFIGGMLVTRSLWFAATYALLTSIGTQFAYALTMGNTIHFIILLTYVTLNLASAVQVLRAETSKTSWWVFGGTLVLAAFGFELWLNYVVPLILGTLFLTAWGRRHAEPALARRALRMAGISAGVLTFYLIIRLQTAVQYVTPGAEEELVVAHQHWVIAVEDVFSNFMALLYMALSNYLPSFLFFTPSLTYYGPGALIDAQNAYHPEYSRFLGASYLFTWRYVAGVLTTIFLWRGWHWGRDAWVKKDKEALIFFLLFIAVITGFSTHLVIKHRPYNCAPMLSYKSLVSTFAFTILLAYWAHLRASAAGAAGAAGAAARRGRRMVIALYLVAFIAALTRPLAMNTGLDAVGMDGYGDPIAVIRGWFQGTPEGEK